ncbi:MAG: ATP-binding protein [Verrucomicrobiota bacterium]|nr:ATP-binding protein [Verrucomicrobiota bacterium]
MMKRKPSRLAAANPIGTTQDSSHEGLVGEVLQQVHSRTRQELDMKEVLSVNADLKSEIVRLQEKLAASERELTAFVYSVSHDLRAPLRAMQGFGRILIEDYGANLDQDGQEYASRIIRAAEQMDGLLADILIYSRAQSREITLNPISLDEAVAFTLRDFKQDIENTHAFIEVAPGLGTVLGNAPALDQVLGEILSNALLYTKLGEPPRVQIRSKSGGGVVRLEVIDQGIGISAEQHQKIFEPFTRLHGADIYKGNGLGLAIVRKVVLNMNGAYGVESAPNEGSRFWIELPAAE